MSRPLFGQVLARMGKLTPIDIDEILVEQAFSGRRFGEIALTWGLCETTDLCDAWCSQAGEDRIDLSQVEPDALALRMLTSDVARRFAVVPLRLIGDVLIVACAQPIDAAEMPELMRAAGRDVRFIQARWEDVSLALDQFYPNAIVEAAA